MRNKMIIFPKNKKGDISITILVLGVFVVCSLTLVRFYITGSDAKKISLPAIMSEKINSLANEAKFYLNPEINKKPEEMMEIFYKASDDKNPSFSGSVDGDTYRIKAVYSKDSVNVFGFGFGEKKEMFSIEQGFKA